MPIGKYLHHGRRAALKQAQTPQDLAAALRAAVLSLARELRNLAAAQGLTPTQTSVLGLLERKGPLRASEIAAREALNPTLVSRVLAGLESEGHLTRRRDADDARATLVEVSPTGRALAVELRLRRTRWLEERLAALSPEQVESLLGALPALQALATRPEDRRDQPADREREESR